MGTPGAKVRPTSGAQQLRNNATTAEVCALGANGSCAFCQRTGQPILPLRYAVVPTWLDKRARKTLEREQTLGTDLPPDSQFQVNEYAVRTLRAGYLHVYLGRPGYWQVYAVTADGLLRLLPDPDSADAKADREMTQACARQGHNVPASFIHIPPRFQSSTIYIAFASQAWSRRVRGRYEKEPWRRMQSFDCEQLASREAVVVDAFKVAPDGSNLGPVVEEYVPDNATAALRIRYPTRERVDENRSGKLEEGPGNWFGAHGYYPRVAQSALVGDVVSQYAIDTDKQGKVRKVSAVVLNDAVGVAQDLNAMRLRCVKWLSDYTSHPTILRPRLVSQSIVALKTMVEASAATALVEKEKKDGTPDRHTITIPSGMPAPPTVITTTREERIAGAKRRGWERLADRYDETARVAFHARYEKESTEFLQLIEKADHDWAAWIADERWKTWLDDYDVDRNDEAGNLVQVCAPCLAGGTVSKASREVWAKWLNGDPSATDNPVYAALFARQKPLLDFLLPDGPTPAGGTSVDKGDNSYDAIKSFVGSERFSSWAAPPLLHAAAQIQAAITGAALALGDRVTARADAVISRAQQLVLKIYANVEVTLLRVQMTVGEYHKFLAEQAYKKLDNAVDGLVRAGSRTVRSIALTGILAIRNPAIRDTVIDVTIWTFENAARVQAALQRAQAGVNRVLNLTAAQLSAAVRQLQVHGMTLGHDAARTLRRLEGSLSLRAGQVGGFVRDIAGKGSRVAAAAAGPAVILAAAAIYFQAWSFRDGVNEMEKKFGREKTESLIGIWADGAGVVAGAMEVMGLTAERLAQKVGPSLAARLSAPAAKLIAGAGWIAVGASALEGVQSFMAAARTGGSGDTDAAAAYFVSGALFIAGSVATGYVTVLGASATLGPIVLAIALLVLAVVALWWAINAEDTQAEIWLDRCYFGYHMRTEGGWTDDQVEQEITELNAVVMGLNAQLHWEDKWGMDQVSLRLTMPGFSSERSAYEYRISVRDQQGAWLAATGGRYNRPIPQASMSAWDGVRRGPDPATAFDFSQRPQSRTETDAAGGTTLIVDHTVRVSDELFSATKISFEYWADVEDEAAVSTIEHLVVD